ncbi:MAG: hypothetical protein KGJ80_14375, partial [Chloroflexota bacterium]|nr:hypothetical protein [Chloroflexota bacterium]
MKQVRFLKTLVIGGAIALLVGFLGFSMPSGDAGSTSSIVQLGTGQPAYASGGLLDYLPLVSKGNPPSSFAIYLPLVFKDYPPPTTVFGIQMDSVTEGGGLSKVAEAKATWVGGIGVSWGAVEPSQGARNWTALASQEQQMQNVAGKGLTPIVNVRYTPGWAQLYPGYSCGPMQQAYFSNFASFMRDLVTRYSVAPYNIKYWEIWNEPDIDHSLPGFPGDSGYGCWGKQSDPYYGGGYYADMLKVVYPQIKTADPQAKVLIGGLLLDCDPRGSPSVCAIVHPTDPYADRPPKFLEGILQGGGGPYFDGVSFHAYDYYQGPLGNYSNANWQSAWNTTGPVVIAKSNFITTKLNDYLIPGKFLMNTESAVLCDSCSNDTVYETTKAYYVAQVYASAIAQGLKAN